MMNLDEIRMSNGDVPAYAWPGGYAIQYITADGGTLCAACVNGGNGSEASQEPDTPADWRVEGYQTVEGETDEVRCDHCNTIIHFEERGPETPEEHEEYRNEVELNNPNKEK
jgi:hypothetical protein